MNREQSTGEGEARRPSPAVLLDVTRLVALRWSGRHETGIDRVCLAYLRHYRDRARAVVQHRGIVRVLGPRASSSLFTLLAAPTAATARERLALRLATALLRGEQPPAGSLYLNVGHTDFDLPAHAAWVIRNRLRAFYLVHDLIPIGHPQHCRPHAVARHTGRVLGALRHGRGVIVGSGAVETDLRDFAWSRRLAPPPIVAAPLAAAALPHPGVLPMRDHFLCVGTIESRKNHALLLDVWERLAIRLGAGAPRLVIAGQWGHGSEAVRSRLAGSAALRRVVDVIDRCDDRRLVQLMVQSRAVLMPTLAEGFGLPMVEALALGVPVVASDLPCFREVGKGVPRLLPPGDVDAWEHCILALDAAGARRRRRIDALHGFQPPSWQDHFARVDAFLDREGRPEPGSAIDEAAPAGRVRLVA